LVFNQFTQFVSDASGWAYAVVFAFALFDAIVPVVPSESSVITAGVVAAAGHLSLALVVVSASAGAVAGDNIAYLIGRRFGEPVTNRFFASSKARGRLAWARRQLNERGGQLILVGRFIPGGRTVVTISAGTLRFPWPRFVAVDTVAGVGWALYAALLGYFGGRVFEAAPWKGLLLALGIGFAVAGMVEAGRWALRHRRASLRGRAVPGGDDARPR
jgi:membrane-associated protein